MTEPIESSLPDPDTYVPMQPGRPPRWWEMPLFMLGVLVAFLLAFAALIWLAIRLAEVGVWLVEEAGYVRALLIVVATPIGIATVVANRPGAREARQRRRRGGR